MSRTIFDRRGGRAAKEHSSSPRSMYHRRLRCEPLEDRSLLSVGVAGPASADQPTGGAAAVAPMVAPTISNIVVVTAQGLMTWNAQSPASILGSTLSVDGTPVKVNGPFAAPIGSNFSGVFGSLAAGTHSFTITAQDSLGNVGQTVGTFNVTTTGPTISSVVPVPAEGLMTWNVQSAVTLASSTLTVDGSPVTRISGPFKAANGGVNFSGSFGSLAAGNHTFTITATDTLNNSTQSSGTFTVTAVGPKISSVVTVPAQGVITWNAQSAAGITGSTLSVDGTPVTRISGPFASSTGGVNFSGSVGSQPAGTHNFIITATDGLGNSTQFNGSFTVSQAGPTISNVVVVPAQGMMSWNVQSPVTVVSSTLTVDGTPVTQVFGPFQANNGGVNFSGFFGSQSAGTHTFTITATDNSNNISQSTGTFTVSSVGPTISHVVTLPAQGLMTWNVASDGGVVNSSLSVDGTPVLDVSGPFASSTGGVNFSGFFGSQSAGSHNFVITATDNLGNSSQFTGSFVVTQVGPTISSVVVLPAQGLMTWNVQDPGTVVSSTLTVDGSPIVNVFGPFAASPGVNFSGFFGNLAAGTHRYSISATDNLNNSSQLTGSFSV
ncbi:MAG: hypothetical protein ABFC96_00240 [Thermoguttaceae bacterium]